MSPGQADKTVFVVGDGSWGTALAVVLGAAGHRVHLWSHFPEQARAMVEHHENRAFLPGIELPEAVEPTSSLDHLNSADYILVVY
ncbi:MAG: 2-dehydropantoate 2-reductase N-terminal domain-containing protein, partial [Planctomycetota bacterium]